MKYYKKTICVVFAVLAVCLIAAAILTYALIKRDVQNSAFKGVGELTLTGGILFGKDTAKLKIDPESPCTVKVTMNCQYRKDNSPNYYWTGEKTDTVESDGTGNDPHTIVIRHRSINYAEAVVEVTYPDGTTETQTLSLSKKV